MPRALDDSMDVAEAVTRTVGLSVTPTMQHRGSDGFLSEELLSRPAEDSNTFDPPTWFTKGSIVSSIFEGNAIVVRCLYAFLLIVPTLACGAEIVDAIVNISDNGDPTGLQVVLLIQAAAWLLWCIWFVLAFYTVGAVFVELF